MVGAISGWSPYYGNYNYGSYRTRNVSAGEHTAQTQAAGKPAGKVTSVSRAADPEIPVQPVQASPVVGTEASGNVGLIIPFLRQGADPAEMAVRMRMVNADPVQDALKENECQTCAKRKYQDGSDDPGVSYQTPTQIDPENAAAAVRGHEMEHVVREQAKAEREGREVISQSVSLHTAICPECGDVYIAGGTTRTVTAEKSQPVQDERQREPFSAVA